MRKIEGITMTELAVAFLAFLGGCLGTFLSSYFKKKGENLATKQDVASITEAVESVKSIIKTNHHLKKETYLEALELIDAELSNRLAAIEEYADKVSKQYVPIKQARATHNKLTVVCNDPEIVNLFLDIIVPKSGSEQGNPIELFEKFRNLVRKELGFKELMEYQDSERVIIGRGQFQPPEERASLNNE